jgi:hypothetical protein
MTILYELEISTAGHYEPEIPTAGHYEFKNGASFRSVQIELCICDKVSVSADRLSTHTNFKKKCRLLLELHAILIPSTMFPK